MSVLTRHRRAARANESAAYYGSLSCGASNSKGNWEEWTASTPWDVGTVVVLFARSLTSANSFLIDIGTGASTAEVVRVENIHTSGAAANTMCGPGIVILPLRIPAGTRIALRGQTNQAAARSVEVVLNLHSASPLIPSYARCATFGAVTASSRGTQVDPGGTADTKTRVEIVASTQTPIRHLIPICSLDNAAPTACGWAVDVEVGGSGSERIIIPDLTFRTAGGGGGGTAPAFGGWSVDIPVGSRIAVNAQCSIIDATDRLVYVSLLGLS